MKTLREKVDELYEELIYCDFRTSIGVDKAKKKIRLALKHQDRDTRHACADIIANANINFDSAVNDIMNTNNGIKLKGL